MIIVKTKVIQARISERLLERFDAALEWEGVSRSDVILQAIREYCDRIEQKKGELKMMFTKEKARKYVEWFKETLEQQSTADPCIYFHNGKIGFSTGSQIDGTAQAVYGGNAEILVDKERWMNWYDINDEDKAELIYDTIIDFLEGD